jgi:uncharacterized membrane protein
MATIRNPIEWTFDQFRLAGLAMGAAGHAIGGTRQQAPSPPLAVRRVTVEDLKDILAKGIADFFACRTDVIFLSLIYPAAGLIIARLAFRHDMLHLLFPLASGFALIGPFAAVGLYEMSRRREQNIHAAWPDAFSLLRSPAFGTITVLGLLLVAIFLAWLGVAMGIYAMTLGPNPPESLGSFLRDVFTTGPGWTLIILGVGTGFLFALLVLTIGVVSFPLALDRDVTVGTAIWTSVRAVVANPGPMAAWGLIVAGGLVIGSIPLLLGLIVVMPVLGHATWHLYRAMVPRNRRAGILMEPSIRRQDCD